MRIDPHDDSLIRARDGYWFVIAIRPGTLVTCPHCYRDIRITAMVFEEAACAHCKSAGRDGRIHAVYFPLGESLLEHLRKIDPERDGIQRITAEADAANDALLKARERHTSNHIEAATKDAITSILDIKSVGYTGKEKSWDR